MRDLAAQSELPALMGWSDLPPGLGDANSRYRQMFDALPAAIYTTDAKGRITYFNPACIEFSGRTPKLGSDHWCVTWKLYYPDGTRMPHDQCPMATALKEGRIIRGAEGIAERPDGTRIWFAPFPTPLRDGDGKIVGGINMLVDITERKKAELAQARLAAIVESSDDAIVSKNLDGIITSWNRGAERLFGYTAQEAIGKSVTMLIPTDRINEEPGILERIRCGERIDHYETVRCRKDGSLVDVSLTVSPVRDASGTVVGASKIARDITERKRQQEALRQSEQKLQRVLETDAVAVLFFDYQGTLIGTNDVFLRMTGYRREQVERRELTWRTMTPPEWVEASEKQMEQFARTGRIGPYEKEYFLADGTRRWMVFAGRDLGDGTIAEFCIDITDHKKREADGRALAALGSQIITADEPQAIYEKIVNAAVVLMRSDFASMQLFHPDRGEAGELELLAQHGFNPEATKFWKWVSGKSTCVCGLTLRDGARVIIPEAARCDRLDEGQKAAYRNAGICAMQSTPLVSRSGKLLGMISTHWRDPHQPTETELSNFDILARQAADVLERSQAEQAIRQNEARLARAKEEAEAANIAKDNFLATLSHELRTPLTPVLATLSTWEASHAFPRELAEDLAVVRRNVDLEARLIDDLLDLTRIAKGKIALNLEVLDVRKVLDTVIAMYLDEIKSKRINLSVRPEAAQCYVRGDPGRLQQAFWNVLKNAVKFTPEGGNIDIATRNDQQGRVQIIVTDTGTGISQDMLRRLFQPFEQETAGRYGGLGLGLAITKTLLEAQQGTIEAKSDGLGRGASFIITLPCVSLPLASAPVTPAPGESECQSADGGYRVLLVEDHPDTARVLARLLGVDGHSVRTTHSVAEALGVLRGDHFDILVSDIGLPDGTGIDLIRAVRNELCKNMPAVALTGFGMEEDIRRTREAGFDEHLTKPINFARLVETIRRVGSQTIRA